MPLVNTSGSTSGTIAVFFDPAEPTIKGITNTVGVNVDSIRQTIGVRVGQVDGTVAVYFSPANPSVNATFAAASLEVTPTTGSRRLYDEAYQAQRVLVVGSEPNASLQVRGITDSINVYLGGTAGTLGVRVGQVDGTIATYFSPANPIVTTVNGVISTNNSSVATLGIGAVFTGTADDVTNYSQVIIQVISDVASAASGLSLQQSPDGTNWDNIHTHSVVAATGLEIHHPVHAKYFRVVYTNGATGQAYFRLQVNYKTIPALGEIQPMGLALDSTDMALATHGVITGVTTAGGGGYVDVKVTPSGALTAAVTLNDGTDTALITAAGELNVLESNSAAIKTAVEIIDNAIAGSEMQVDVVTSALPSGAATSAKQDTIIGHVDGIETLLGTIDGDTGNIATAVADIPNVIGTDGAAGPTKVVSIGGTQTTGEIQEIQVDADGQLQVDVLTMPTVAVTGTFWQATQPISAASLPLPTGASTLAEQQTQTTHLATIAGDTTSIQTAVELIDDTVATLGTTTYTETSTKGLTIGAVRRDADTTLVGTTNEIGPLQMDENGRLKVEIFDGGNSHTVDGTVSITANSAVNVAQINGVTPLMGAGNTGTGSHRVTIASDDTILTGSTPYHLVSAATTNATNVKNAAGKVYGIYASNVNAAARYLKLYNKASAPTVGTDTPVHTFIIPGNTAGAGTNIPIPNRGINFSTGISFALTTEATDAGTTAVAASEIVVNLDYI